MTQKLDHVCETLSIERDVHRELLWLSEQKKDAITKNDVSSLDRIVKEEEVLLPTLLQCERRRKDCMQALAGQLDHGPQEMTLQNILPLCEPEQRERLTELQGDLKSLLERQVTINDLNKKLIESRLEYISYSLETLSDAGQESFQTYGGEGLDPGRSARKNSIIDQKV